MVQTETVRICPWCLHELSNSWSSISTKDYASDAESQSYAYRECRSCGSFVLIDRPIPTEIGKIYPSNAYPPYLSQRISPVPDAGDSVILDALPTNRQCVIADFGMGSGDYLRKWYALCPGCLLLGVDFDVSAAVDRVGDIRAEVYSSEEFLEQTTTLDHINFSHSLEHLAEPRRILAHAVQRLVPGGVLRIRVPISTSLAFRCFRKHWFALEAPRHFTIPSAHALVNLCTRDLSLTLLSERYYGSPSVFQRTLNYVIKDPDSSKAQLRMACRLMPLTQSKTLAVLAERFKLSSKVEFLLRKPSTT